MTNKIEREKLIKEIEILRRRSNNLIISNHKLPEVKDNGEPLEDLQKCRDEYKTCWEILVLRIQSNCNPKVDPSYQKRYDKKIDNIKEKKNKLQ